MALSANSTIRRNIAFNLPRAAVNYNDGAFGGHLLERNLFFNAVSQCVGHGALWLARKPWLRHVSASGARDSRPRCVPAYFRYGMV